MELVKLTVRSFPPLRRGVCVPRCTQLPQITHTKLTVMPTFQIIKQKPFTTKDNKSGIHYSVTYKGRVFGLNTLRFEGEEKDFLIVSGNKIQTGDVELRKTTKVDALTGEVSTFLDLVPKLDIALGL